MHDGPCRPTVAVLLPGSGSDHVFVASVFAEPLAALGIRLVAPPPRPGRETVSAMWRALDGAVGGTAALVGGISLGAHVATRWATRHPDRCAGLLVALPAWVGAPGSAPAAVSAAAAADAVRRDGVHRVLGSVRAEAQPGLSWLADELNRAWLGYGAGLADALHAASAAAAPTIDELRAVPAPTGIAALSDDPLHPPSVARRWAEALPRAAVVTTSLHAVGRDRAVLGRATVLAWLRARAHAAASTGDDVTSPHF